MRKLEHMYSKTEIKKKLIHVLRRLIRALRTQLFNGTKYSKVVKREMEESYICMYVMHV